MEKKRTLYEVKLGSSWAKTTELPPEVAETCRETLGALQAALESDAFERAVGSGMALDVRPTATAP